MATCTITITITIVDLDDGSVSIEIAYDALEAGTASKAQQIAVALRNSLQELGMAFDTPAAQAAG